MNLDNPYLSNSANGVFNPPNLKGGGAGLQNHCKRCVLFSDKPGIIVRGDVTTEGGAPLEPHPHATQARMDIQTGLDTYQDALFLKPNIRKTLTTCPERAVAPDVRPRAHFCSTPPGPSPPFDFSDKPHPKFRLNLAPQSCVSSGARRVPPTGLRLLR